MSRAVVKHSWHGDLVCSIERSGDGMVLRAADRLDPSPIAFRWSLDRLRDLSDSDEVTLPGGATISGFATALATLGVS